MRKPVVSLLVCLIVCFWGAAWGAILEDDDVIIDFGLSGIWTRYNDASWAKLHPANPDLITTGDMDGNDRDDVIIDFGGSGIWVRMNNTSWAKLHPSNPDSISTGDMDGNGLDDVIIDFGGSGIWARMNDTSWTKLHPSNCDAIATGDVDGNGLDEIIIDFGASGIWVWMNNASWTKLHPSNPDGVTIGDMDGNGLDDVVIDFGVSGIWVRMNGSSWSKLHSADPDSMATGDMDGNGQDEVIIDFGSSGTWIRYNDAAWAKLHPASPGGIATGDMDGNDHEEVILDFGASGLWVRYNDMSWAKLHPANCELITTGNIDRNRPTNIMLVQGNIRLKDDPSGSKSYYYRIGVKDKDGRIMTESNRITKVEILPHQSIEEIPQSGSRVLWYSSEFYRDPDGNGPNLPAWSPWSEVHGYLDVPVGSLDEGFYRGVVTDTSNQKHAIWLYYEVPTETNKIEASSMNVSDRGDGTLRFSWTNPLDIDPSKHMVGLFVSTTWDSGDGFNDRLLRVFLPATENAYTMPAEEVTRIMGYPGLYWRVRVVEFANNIVDPDSTSKNYEVYRNYSPKQMFPSIQEDSVLLLDGVDDRAEASSTLLTAGTVESFTAEAWIYPTMAADMFVLSDDALDIIVDYNAEAANNGLGIGVFAWDQTCGFMQQSSSVFRDISLNQWNHVAVMFDAPTSQFTISINGNFGTLRDFTGTFCDDDTQQFSVGAFFNSNSITFQGEIDEVRVSSLVRYVSNFAPQDSFAADGSTIGLWHFNEPVGSTSFSDSSGNGNTLTGINGARTN